MGVLGNFTAERMTKEQVCPICHHRYVVYPWQNWVYKFRPRGKESSSIEVCSWHCLQELKSRYPAETKRRKRKEEHQ